MAESLSLTGNVLSDWVFDRLKYQSRAKPTKSLLSTYQNAACYYAALGVKHHKTMGKAEKVKKVTESYGQFTAEAFLLWMTEEAAHDYPEWLTRTMLGRTTMTGACVLFDPTKDQLWRRYQASGANIRAVINPLVDEYMDLYGEEHELFPSKEQAADLMEYVHQKAWAAGDGKPRRMKKGDFEEALAEGKIIERVDDARARGKGNTGKDRTCGRERQASPAAIEASPEGHTECKPDDGTNVQQKRRYPEPGRRSSPEYGRAGGREEDEPPDVIELEASSDMFTVINSMPKNYLLENALVFALYGKLSNSAMRDPDLDLSASDASPSRKKKMKAGDGWRAEAVNAELGGDSSPGHQPSFHGGLVELMAGVVESQIREESRKARSKEAVLASAPSGGGNLKRKIVDIFSEEDSQQTKLVEHAAKMSDALVLSVQIRKRNAEIEWLRGKIALLTDIGSAEEIAAAKAELLVLYNKSLVAPTSAAESSVEVPMGL